MSLWARRRNWGVEREVGSEKQRLWYVRNKGVVRWMVALANFPASRFPLPASRFPH